MTNPIQTRADGKIMWEARCPECDTVLDGALDVSGGRAAPAPGDITVCGYCGEILVFEADRLRQISCEELDALAPEERRDLSRAKMIVELARRRS